MTPSAEPPASSIFFLLPKPWLWKSGIPIAKAFQFFVTITCVGPIDQLITA